MNNKEKFEKMPWSKESVFEQRKKELEADGFTFVGQESLTTFKFTENARFMAVPICTKKQIVQKYIDRYKGKIDIEVELVDVEGLDQKQQAVYVFIRPKK